MEAVEAVEAAEVVEAREAGGSTFRIRTRAGSQERQLQATARGKSNGDGGDACGVYKMGQGTCSAWAAQPVGNRRPEARHGPSLRPSSAPDGQIPEWPSSTCFDLYAVDIGV